jgi:RimJ/RimL family protein N-acetyltransferase
MSWINSNTILNGKLVALIPLETNHFEELELLARDTRIWEFIPADMSSSEKCLKAFQTAFDNREKGTEFPFVIYSKTENKLIGSTRLMEIVPLHRRIEIGWTWLHPEYWATSVNLECKLLLLTFCFEDLKAIRVQLKTDEKNLRSRKAIEKIGAQYEGILRQDRIRDNGTIRSTAYFSIIDSEWNTAKKNLTTLLATKE